ncbi:MAG: FAD:protein FMN transferase, partial [Kiritimatiellae bacterium]|nr:FAD:protein FMN transferase [Kiritimatiellia bacterium]
LRMANFTDFLINLGGNIRVSGRPERGRDEWRVAIRDPANPSRTTGQIAILHSGEAVATSGSYERYVEIDGRRFSHIVDPRTGHPVARQGSVSVVADTAERADACSTAFFVMGLGSEDGGAVLLRAQVVIQASDDGSMPNP